VRFTPLDALTGFRAAAGHVGTTRAGGTTEGGGATGGNGTTGGGVVRWAQPRESTHPNAFQPEPHPTDQSRSTYRHILAAFARNSVRHPHDVTCYRCGKPPHIDWGHQYERLVCMEITAA
jgi:hypothetical protein